MTARSLKFGAALVGGALVARAAVRRLLRYDLRDKVAIVTGGSRGLGLVIARELVRHHAKVVICARDRGELERARADLLARGGRVLAVPVDVTNRVQIAQLVEIVHQHWGRIDVVINNAGVIQVGPMEVMTTSDYEEAMQTHFWGPLHLVLAVLPEMRGRREGRIVNITSIGGKLAVPHLLPYSASKFALVGFSEGLRAELAKDGIVVTTVVPGLMRTGSVVQAMFKGQHEQEYAWFAASGSSYATSMRVERAARRIVAALCNGDAEVTLSVQAQLAALAHGIAPGLVQRALGWVARALPSVGGIGPGRVRGAHDADVLAGSTLGARIERATERNNER
jgi:NAD(P)-dependent dehydrogenase (short-subunit alcohol dehydrogenase family)